MVNLTDQQVQEILENIFACYQEQLKKYNTTNSDGLHPTGMFIVFNTCADRGFSTMIGTIDPNDVISALNTQIEQYMKDSGICVIKIK